MRADEECVNVQDLGLGLCLGLGLGYFLSEGPMVWGFERGRVPLFLGFYCIFISKFFKNVPLRVQFYLLTPYPCVRH